ncbi:helix-turn-helix domain-containing protein [Niabella yanshanensis]|uniref:Helix-turn-helix domain-containing protein n=1 Tax=Niabella yanshanensis TaxID=577386 RepID=A0ABZ0WDD8_9BACT|nr:helix-turn-helix domain-containing protein [Niabella yanshanensis]WQD40702.1 helix-turn-helix domain-containing protein [Niabella yanshanensis]
MEHKKAGSRGIEIVEQYFAFLDRHLADLLEDRVDDMLTISQIAQHLFIAPGHLTNTLTKETGRHPCYYYDLKIIEVANKLLLNTALSGSEIARRLTFDPSNFVKFYKSITGITPAIFREKKVLPPVLPIEGKKYTR